jgi:predicted kinase
MEAVIFIGVQGSGKTTFYRERFSDSHIRISLDKLRTREREQLRLVACLHAGQSFVIDNTNPSISDRMRYIESARTAGFRVVAYFFESTLNDAIRRNNQRSGKQRIPVAGIAATFRKLQPPSMEEGFDTIHTVKIGGDGRFVVTGPSDDVGVTSPAHH